MKTEQWIVWKPRETGSQMVAGREGVPWGGMNEIRSSSWSQAVRWEVKHISQKKHLSFSVEYTWLWLEVSTLHLEEKSVSAHSGQGMYKKPVLWVATGTVLISGHPYDSSGLHGDFSSDFAPMAPDLALARHQNASCGKAVVLQRWNSNRPNFRGKEVKI